MLVEVPLTDDKRAAVEGDDNAVPQLIDRPAGVASPAGARSQELTPDRDRPDDTDTGEPS